MCDHVAPWDALEQSGIHKSTHARDFELQFWFLVRGIVAGGEVGFSADRYLLALKFGARAESFSLRSRGDTS